MCRQAVVSLVMVWVVLSGRAGAEITPTDLPAGDYPGTTSGGDVFSFHVSWIEADLVVGVDLSQLTGQTLLDVQAVENWMVWRDHQAWMDPEFFSSGTDALHAGSILLSGFDPSCPAAIETAVFDGDWQPLKDIFLNTGPTRRSVTITSDLVLKLARPEMSEWITELAHVSLTLADLNFRVGIGKSPPGTLLSMPFPAAARVTIAEQDPHVYSVDIGEQAQLTIESLRRLTVDDALRNDGLILLEADTTIDGDGILTNGSTPDSTGEGIEISRLVPGRATLAVNTVSNKTIAIQSAQTLRVAGCLLNNASIEAWGSGVVEIHEGGQICGGHLVGDGWFVPSGAGGVLEDVTVDPNVRVTVRQGGRLGLAGTITNDGSLDVFSDGSAEYPARLHAVEDVTLYGSGALEMWKDLIQIHAPCSLTGEPGATVTNASGHAIRCLGGDGEHEITANLANVGNLEVLSGQLAIINEHTTNQGMMRSAGGRLRIDSGSFVNDGVLRAEAGGTILLAGPVANHTSIEVQAGGTVGIGDGAEVNGEFTGSGLIRAAGQTGLLRDATIGSALVVRTEDGEALALAGTITNDGLLALASEGSSQDARLHAAGNVTLAGDGSLEMWKDSIQSHGPCRVTGEPGATVTNASGHAVRCLGGDGEHEITANLTNAGTLEVLSGQLAVINEHTTNQGVMRSAGGRLRIDSGSFVNDGVLRAEAGGTIRLDGPVANHTCIEAQAGGAVGIGDGAEVNGVLTGAGTFTAAGQTGLLVGVSIDPQTSVLIEGGRSLTMFGSVTNDGLIDLYGNSSGYAALDLDGDVVLGGDGVLQLRKSWKSSDGSSGIHAAGEVTLTNEAGHTISAAGGDGIVEIQPLLRNYGNLEVADHARLRLAETLYHAGEIHAVGQFLYETIELDGGRIEAAVFPVRESNALVGVGEIVGDLSNAGRIAPGASLGEIAVDGSYSQTGRLEMEIGPAGGGDCDVLSVTGDVTLGGTLSLDWLAPPGDADATFGGAYTILTWGGQRTGAFSAVECELAAYLDDSGFAWGVEYDDENGRATVHVCEMLTGDLDLDGEVGRDDLVTMIGGYGTAGTGRSGGDLNADGLVDWQDYLLLKAGLGTSVPVATPEPAALALLAAGALAMLRRRRI